jgi:hypothetical protein
MVDSRVVFAAVKEAGLSGNRSTSPNSRVLDEETLPQIAQACHELFTMLFTGNEVILPEAETVDRALYRKQGDIKSLNAGADFPFISEEDSAELMSLLSS